MRKDNEVKYCLYDVKWAFTEDGLFTIPFIWNKDRTKIKTIVDGEVYCPEILAGKGEVSQAMYHDAVKSQLSKTAGINIDAICNTKYIIDKCHNDKMKKGAIMRTFEWRKKREEFKYGFGSSFGYSSIFVENNRFGVEDILVLGDNFSRLLVKDFETAKQSVEEYEPSYAEF